MDFEGCGKSRPGELVLHDADAPHAFVVGGLERLEFIRPDGRREHQRMSEVVEDDEVVRNHEGGGGPPEAGLRRGKIFEFADGFVSDRAHGAADEGGHVGGKRGREALHESSHCHERTVRGREFSLPAFRGRVKGFPVLDGEDAPRVEADEGIAPEAFSRLDGFEEKDVFVILETREDGDRRLHVGAKFFGDGDKVALQGKVGKFLEAQHGGFDSGRKKRKEKTKKIGTKKRGLQG